MSDEIARLAIELGEWPRGKDQARVLLAGTGWFYMPKTGAIKNHETRRTVLKPEWKRERQRLEAQATEHERTGGEP